MQCPPPRFAASRSPGLVAATYFMVSGGPTASRSWSPAPAIPAAFSSSFSRPLLWALPTALMVGELSAALPEEGGYYAWVRRALGPFWGFQEAWLSLVASIFDMAIYPTLFVALSRAALAAALAHGHNAHRSSARPDRACALRGICSARKPSATAPS